MKRAKKSVANRVSGTVQQVRRRTDSIVNAITAMGTARDPRTASTFRFHLMQPEYLAEVFAAGGVARRICELPAKEMTRGWWSFKATHSDAERAADVDKYIRGREEELSVLRAFREAETWARAQGGGVIVIGLNDGAERMSEPLRRGRHAINWLQVYERVDVQIERLNNDTNSKRYGRPETYRILRRADGSPGFASVHASRVLHFRGMATPNRYRWENEDWDLSVIQYVYDAVRDLSSGYGDLARLPGEFATPVYRMDGQTEMLEGGNSSLIVEAMSLLNLGKSLANAIVIDKEDEFSRQSPTVAGLSEVFNQSKEHVCMLTGISMTKLFGVSPGGLNATGESDARNWADEVNAEQVDKHGPPLERLRWLLLNEPDCPTPPEDLEDWEQAPNPLYQPTDKETADTGLVRAQTAQTYYNMVDLGSGRRALSVAEVRANLGTESAYVLEEDAPSTASPALTAALTKLSIAGAQASAPEEAASSETEMPAASTSATSSGPAAPATLNELGLNYERIARIGDVDVVNMLRSAMARQLGEVQPEPLTLEQLTALRGEVVGAEVGAEVGAAAAAKEDAARYDGLFQQGGELAGFDVNALLVALERLFLDEGVELGEGEAARIGQPDAFRVENPHFTRALETFRLERIPGINATTMEALSVIFAEVSSKGLGREATVREMRTIYADFSKARAERIVRTEMTAIQSAANYAAWDDAPGVEESEWSAAFRNTRDSHSAMHGQRRRIGEKFRSGDGNEALHPGGFTVAAENINCQCIVLPVTSLTDGADGVRADAAGAPAIMRAREASIERLFGPTFEALMKQFDDAVIG